MSYEEFRRRIDTARQILVGAVPSPAGQIDQITYALIYKFMNDIDDQAAALGGKRAYFTGDYAKFNWHELMSSQLGAHERLELYREAIQTMDKNENIPELFRSIYQNAFLPFNSANVLTLFLKEIDKFSHGESDDIGDAYEYLLSITGAQGDVGQFRTPRHIIKFIVEAVNPTKDDKVLDPAVGTAGFLIAAYNHVKSQHDGKNPDGTSNDEKRLTADELHKVHHHYRGFDIDPTMVRTAKVNMYLHGFKTPDIINHDSLSSEDYWSDWYDVILANPPFMTPKGGIQPHKKFGISANRAEVLFVDYIASHLKPNGRAGIVVPEGVIFQSGKAYRDLRKNLVENSLYAVVSLPAGVFNPYAGVKTSVLLLDKELAKQNDEILFVKVENDGYSLSAQRRPIAGNQLPEALQVIERFKSGEELQTEFAHAVPRREIADRGEYNLTGDRYLVSEVYLRDYPLVKISQLAEIIMGQSPKGDSYNTTGEGVPLLNGPVEMGEKYPKQTKFTTSPTKMCKPGDILMTIRATLGVINVADRDYCLGRGVAAFRPLRDGILKDFLSYTLRASVERLSKKMVGAIIKGISRNDILELEVPLPPIEIQREIVAELDGYQKIIDATQTIIKTYKPTIKISLEWETEEIGNLFHMHNGRAFKSTEWSHNGLPIIRIANLNSDQADYNYFDGDYDDKILVKSGELLFSWSGTRGTSFGPHLWTRQPGLLNQHIFKMIPKDEMIDLLFAYYYLEDIVPAIEAKAHGAGGLVHITKAELSKFSIPLPPIEIQREIVAELEAEKKLIDANKKLIKIYQQKIKSKIAEVWGE